MHVKHHKQIPTAWARQVLWTRMSLRETQTEFARRFGISWITIHRWESGKVKKAYHVHERVLGAIMNNLKTEGRLMPQEVFETYYREEIERKDELANAR